MHFTLILGAVTTLLALGSSTPLAQTGTNDKRSGNQQATAFGSSSCAGEDLGFNVDFGCGGICHTTDGTAGYSFLLSQAIGDDDVNPTASLFSDENCQDQVAKVGINRGQKDGCTNTAAFKSFYLYYNC